VYSHAFSMCSLSEIMDVIIPQVPGGGYKVRVSVVEEVKVDITNQVLEEGLGNKEVSHMSMQ